MMPPAISNRTPPPVRSAILPQFHRRRESAPELMRWLLTSDIETPPIKISLPAGSRSRQIRSLDERPSAQSAYRPPPARLIRRCAKRNEREWAQPLTRPREQRKLLTRDARALPGQGRACS